MEQSPSVQDKDRFVRNIGDSALQDTIEMPIITEDMLANYDEEHIVRGED